MPSLAGASHGSVDSILQLPFFGPDHRDAADRLRAFVAEQVEPDAAAADSGDVNAAGREFAARLGRAGVLAFVAERRASGRPDARTIALTREALASSSSIADAVFAVQGLAAFPILLAGSDDIRDAWLPRLRSGAALGAFAITEPDAGSDVNAVATTARADGSEYVLDGSKTLISNAGIADVYVVFARDAGGPARGGRPPLSAFVVPADTPGFAVTRSIALVAPHAIGDLDLRNCRIPASHRLGEAGDGTRVALATLDLFRPTVGAAACGMARRALDEACRYAAERRQFGSAVADFQATRLALADMDTELAAARLLVYRAAWLADTAPPDRRTSREAAQAKLFATETAQRVVDRAVQIHGGKGVTKGIVVERLYREVRALRIYEGTSEIQRLVIADALLKEP